VHLEKSSSFFKRLLDYVDEDTQGRFVHASKSEEVKRPK
jgi:hypothetical protein